MQSAKEGNLHHREPKKTALHDNIEIEEHFSCLSKQRHERASARGGYELRESRFASPPSARKGP